jgi:hypothetical protein
VNLIIKIKSQVILPLPLKILGEKPVLKAPMGRESRKGNPNNEKKNG